MNTPKTLQQAIIDHLASFDLNQLSMDDLRAYTGIVGQLDTMAKPDFAERLAKMTSFSGFGAAPGDTSKEG